MLNITAKMYNLQELVRRTYLEGLINNVVIQFKDNRMKIEAIGTEDEQGVVDQTLTVDVNYPCETKENGNIALKSLSDVLKALETFQRDDVVQITEMNNKITITRATPLHYIELESADIQYIKTYAQGFKTIFGNPIKLVNNEGKEKVISLDSCAVLDAQRLKEKGSGLSKANPLYVTVSIKDSKLMLSANGSFLISGEVDGVTSATGNATSAISEKILSIIRHGIGTATIRLSEGSPLHIRYEHESSTADYLVQVQPM